MNSLSKKRLTASLLLCISCIGFIPLTLSMQHTTSPTAGRNAINNSVSVASFPTLENPEDKVLSQNAWNLIRSLYALNELVKNISGINIDLEQVIKYFKECNKDVDKVIERIPLLALEMPTVNATLHAYIIFTKGHVSPLVLTAFQGRLTESPYKPYCLHILDKYRYLHFDQHLNLPQELVTFLVNNFGSISLKELLDPQFKKKILPAVISSETSSLPSEEQESSLISFESLRNRSLSSLEGWGDLFTGCLRPDCIVHLDLSRNNLEALFNTLLKGFVNLRKFSAAYNRLKFIDPTVLDDCTLLIELDLSHNELKEIPPRLLIPCKQLQKLFINANTIKILTQEHLDIKHKPALKEVNYDDNPDIRIDSFLEEQLRTLTTRPPMTINSRRDLLLTIGALVLGIIVIALLKNKSTSH